MPRRKKGTPPPLNTHGASGRAYAYPPGSRTPKYFGFAGTQEAVEKYGAWLKTITIEGTPKAEQPEEPDTDICVAQGFHKFLDHADLYYRKNERHTSEYRILRRILGIVNEMYAELPVAEFSLQELRAVREHTLSLGWARSQINGQIRRVVRVFRWLATEGLCPPTVPLILGQLRGLRRGRTTAPESEPVLPVSEKDFFAALPFLNEKLQMVAHCHWLIGCRAGELVALRPCDLERKKEPWVFVPPGHKGTHLEKDRAVLIGPQARGLLEPRLRQLERKDWVFPSKGRGKHAGKGPGHYTVSGYREALQVACEKAGVEPFCPLQVRHAMLTRIREVAGLEAAQVIGGHSEVSTTQIYAERNWKIGAKAIEEHG